MNLNVHSSVPAMGGILRIAFEKTKEKRNVRQWIAYESEEDDTTTTKKEKRKQRQTATTEELCFYFCSFHSHLLLFFHFTIYKCRYTNNDSV